MFKSRQGSPTRDGDATCDVKSEATSVFYTPALPEKNLNTNLLGSEDARVPAGFFHGVLTCSVPLCGSKEVILNVLCR